ncbi:MAG: DUF4142 domain-containing protein, partial [Acidobacteriota bacterium]
AAAGGIIEVEASKIALQKSSDDRVRQFAQHMVDDHTKVGEALKAAASSESITIPDAPDSQQQRMLQRLKGLSGAQFDAAYKTQMLDDHKDAVGMFQQKIRENLKTPLKQFAADNLSTLKAHLQMAEELTASSSSKTSASR